MKRIGVLAMQGAFVEHIAILRRLGAEAVLVCLPQELDGLSGLVIPGGESTAMGMLIQDYELRDKVQGLILNGLPTLGTCAGMILLAKKVIGFKQEPLGAVDIEVRRNAFGRQVDSFETELDIPVLGESPFPGVFIRAPWIEQAGAGVEVLARLPGGTPVAVREGSIIACAFHPELTNDLRFHSYFLSTVNGARGDKAL